MTQTATAAVTDIFDRMMQRDDWYGFGYLGERRNALYDQDPDYTPQPEMVMAADVFILQWAADHKWSAEKFFTWANSKNGRYYGEAMFGTEGTPAERLAYAIRWGVLSVPRR